MILDFFPLPCRVPVEAACVIHDSRFTHRRDAILLVPERGEGVTVHAPGVCNAYVALVIFTEKMPVALMHRMHAAQDARSSSASTCLA
jgi:hypothetical protein